MSCFHVSNTHVFVMAMLAHAPGKVGFSQCVETARVLRALNNASMKARYNDKPGYIRTRDCAKNILAAIDWLRTANNADICKVVQCFDYQCSEAPADYPGRSIVGSIETRVFALPGAGGPSAVWSI